MQFDQVSNAVQQRRGGMIDSAMDAIIRVDSEQRIVAFNHAAEQLFRCPASEAMGCAIGRFIPLGFRQTQQDHIQNFVQGGATIGASASLGTLYAIRADGEEFPIEASIARAQSDQQELFTVILRDVSLGKAMEEQLRQSQQLEALGQLAGGIAHEFNNLLSVIMGYSEILAKRAAQDEYIRSNVAEIKAATQRAALLTRQLLAFSRQQALELRVIDLNQVVWEANRLVRPLLPENIALVPALDEGLRPVKADLAEVQQILIYLAIHARDSMPEGGKIVIETANVDLDQEYARRHLEAQPGPYVMVVVSDTGQGMDEETKARIFQPFSPTRAEGKDAGLGVAAVYGIIRQSGGHIAVESAVGGGTTFRVYLPATAEAPQMGRDAPPLPGEPANGVKTLLVVEDDVALRRLIRATLRLEGYKVLTAKDGIEGLEMLQGNSRTIDLVVSDIVMPSMNGLQLKERAASLCPSLPFLLISGYMEQIAGSGEPRGGGGAFLEKPFYPAELVRKVRELLHETSNQAGSAKTGAGGALANPA